MGLRRNWKGFVLSLAILTQSQAPAGAQDPIRANSFIDSSSQKIGLATLSGDWFETWPGLAAYNSARNEYLVVWPGIIGGEKEILGQRVDAATGQKVGSESFRISHAGPDGDLDFGAELPEITYNAVSDEYFVVWSAGEPAVFNAFEIWGRRIGAGGELLGPEIRISAMGPDGNSNFDGWYPAVAHSEQLNRYLVVWYGDHNSGSLVSGEYEIWGRLVDATGSLLGTQLRLSDFGPDGNSSYTAGSVKVAANADGSEFMVVFSGEDNIAPLVLNEREIFGQRVRASDGAELGDNDFRISAMGPNGATAYDVANAEIVYNHGANEYLVIFAAENNEGSLVNEEYEVYAQRLSTDGTLLGGKVRVSDMGADGSTTEYVYRPRAAYDPRANRYLIVWEGQQNPGSGGQEIEVWGQFLDGTTAAEAGENDFRISHMGPAGTTSYGGYIPSVVFNSYNEEFYITWVGDDGTDLSHPHRYDVHARRYGNVSDLLVTQQLPASVTQGSAWSIPLTVTNTGEEARYLTLSDTLPAGMSFVSAEGSGWNCAASAADSISCTRGTLGLGESCSLLLNISAGSTAAAGTVTNTVTVSSRTFDADAANNSASGSLELQVPTVAVRSCLDFPKPKIKGGKSTATVTFSIKPPAEYKRLEAKLGKKGRPKKINIVQGPKLGASFKFKKLKPGKWKIQYVVEPNGQGALVCDAGTAKVK